MTRPQVRRPRLAPTLLSAGALALGVLVAAAPTSSAATGPVSAASGRGATTPLTVTPARTTPALPAGTTRTPTASFTENTVAAAQLAALDEFGGPEGEARTLSLVNGQPVVASTPVQQPAVGLGTS